MRVESLLLSLQRLRGNKVVTTEIRKDPEYGGIHIAIGQRCCLAIEEMGVRIQEDVRFSRNTWQVSFRNGPQMRLENSCH